MYSQDGYKLIRAEQLLGALRALNDNQITFRAFRAYIGCFELLAIREAAERSKPGTAKKPQRRFLRSEVSALIDERGEARVSRELSSLKAAGLLTFARAAIDITAESGSNELSPLLGSRGGKRLIPVPRQVLKFLAGCTRPALAKTVIAYVLRGLSLERSGKMRSAGTVKISWICALCQISERAARAARAELIRLGWISKDTGSFQRKLNRDGAYFVIDPAWRRVFKRFAPLGARKCTGSAPPKEILETPYGSKNQKAAQPQQPVSQSEAGVCKANDKKRLEVPSLRRIQPDDLRRLSRLRVLYAQATAAKWISHSEANLRNFVAAAARATRVEGDAVRIFIGIVRRGLWHHLTNDDESRAINSLRREREHGERAAADEIRRIENQVGEGTMRSILDLAMKRSSTGVSSTGASTAPATHTRKCL